MFLGSAQSWVSVDQPLFVILAPPLAVPHGRRCPIGISSDAMLALLEQAVRDLFDIRRKTMNSMTAGWVASFVAENEALH